MTLVTELMVLAVVAGLTALLARFLLDYLHFRRLELAIPGPATLPLLGNALDLAAVTPDTVLHTLLRLIGRRAVCRLSVFNQMMFFIGDPADIEELVRRREFNDKSVLVYSLFHVMAKRGLIQLGGAEWKAHRRWLAPGFNKNVLDRFVEVFSEEAVGFAERVETDKVYDVTDNLRTTSLKNFLRTSLDNDTSKFEGVLMDVVLFIDVFLRSTNTRSFNPLLWSETLFLLSATGKQMKRMKVTVEDAVKGMIQHRRALSSSKQSDSRLYRKTVMEIACDESEGGFQMPEEDVLDEVKTFFAANVETTVSAKSWLLKVISMLPDVQERIHAELVEVFGQSDRVVTHEDIPELKYIERVVKECLRMFPPIPFTGRQCYAETKLCGHTIPAGTAIGINIIAAHYDPQHWDNPERFDPDRFLPEKCQDRHPCAYIPFSTGLRNCIGARYATNNLVTFIATTLRRFRVLPVDDHKDLRSLYDNMTFDITSRLVGGVRVQFERRSGEQCARVRGA